MKTQLNEIRRMQRIAGILKEDQDDSEIINDPNFEKLVDALRANPKAANKLEKDLEKSIEEAKYYDYGDTNPKEISKAEFWKRKLTTLGLGAAAGALVGLVSAGGISAHDALEMALAAAASGGALSAGLVSTVGKVSKENQLNEVDDQALIQNIKKLTDDDIKPVSFNVNFDFENVDEEKLLDGMLEIIKKVNPDADIEKKKISLTRDLVKTNEKLYSATQKSFSAFQGLKDYFEDNLEIFK